MTNHPRRNRADENEPSGPEDLVRESPAHTANGSSPAPPPAASIGEAIAGALGATLPQAFFSAFVQALTQVPVQTRQHLCGTCLLVRVTWEQRNRAAVQQAITDACAAAGIPADSPQAGQVDLVAFLPPDLRPGTPSGMPPVQEAITTVNGSEVCPAHIPGAQAGPLIIPVPALTGQALAQFARTMAP